MEGYFPVCFVILEKWALFIRTLPVRLVQRSFESRVEASIIGLLFASIKETNPLSGRGGQGRGEGGWLVW